MINVSLKKEDIDLIEKKEEIVCPSGIIVVSEKYETKGDGLVVLDIFAKKEDVSTHKLLKEFKNKIENKKKEKMNKYKYIRFEDDYEHLDRFEITQLEIAHHLKRIADRLESKW